MNYVPGIALCKPNISWRASQILPFTQKWIFLSTPDTSVLARIMSQREEGSIVDWANLTAADNSDKPATRFIEFRHHEATLNPFELEHWIRFIVALFQAAQIKTAMPIPRPEPGEDGIISWEHEARKYDIDVRNDPLKFLYLLNLDSIALQYWMCRFRRFSGTPSKPTIQPTHDRLTIIPASRLRYPPGNKHALFGCG